MKSVERLVLETSTISSPVSGVAHPEQGPALGLAGGLDLEVEALGRPGVGEVGMGRDLALVGEQQPDHAGRGLRLQLRQTGSASRDGSQVLPAGERVPRLPPREVLFF